MKSLRQILTEVFHERDLPGPGKRPFATMSRNNLENALHDAFVSKFVHGALAYHHWKKAEEQGWQSDPGHPDKNNPPDDAKESLRLCAHHNGLSLKSEQHAAKIFLQLKLRSTPTSTSDGTDYFRIRGLATDTARDQLKAEHGIENWVPST
jgi:hypothetical protein